ncbi:MAG: ribonuclease Y [Anaerolineae bacterium]|nr:ribonuclease Y [Anaerolineae bacterium]
MFWTRSVLVFAASIVGVAVVAFLLGYLLRQYLEESRRKALGEQRDKILEDAQAKAREIVLGAKDEALKVRSEAEREIARRRQELERAEERLQRRQEALEQRSEQLENREKRLNQRQSQLDKRKNELDKLEAQRTAELERISGLSREEAKELLLKAVEEESRQEVAAVIRRVEAEAMEEANRRAAKIISLAIQRMASEQVSELTVSAVDLPSDEMKGRIIGRGGRNIRALEQATGVDLVVDDTPEAVIVSAFDPVRREVARRALEKLVMDGRIHPGRIEKVVHKTEEEVEQIIREEGANTVQELGVHGLHPDLVRLLGVLKFRTSYGQNQLLHSVETARLASIMAAELGANVQLAKVGGLLHDIGKAVDHEVEGPHAIIGADIARRYGLSDELVNCIAAHHGEEEPKTVEAVLIQAADAISGARPGARRESLEAYVKRIKALEEVANSFPGVEQCYAIQAGREIRVIVKPEEVDDLAAIRLSKEIAQKIEENLEYPGQIKVTVIRETRAVDYAK